MNLPFYIARKYFLSKKKKNFINVISIISMLVVGISTMALVIVLSVFNGLEDLLRSLYGSFDPEVVISPAEGKSFEYDQRLVDKLAAVPGIGVITEVIEDNVLIKYQNSQRVVRLKGVSEEFVGAGKLESAIVYGDPVLRKNEINYAIIGRGVQYDLSINPANDFYTIQVYYPKNIDPGIANPMRAFSVQHILPSAIFAIEKYYDENYIFVPIQFAMTLFQYGNKRTSLELYLDNSSDPDKVKAELKSALGDTYRIKLGEELHEDLYKILRIEKLFVYIVFGLIIGIASINIYFALTMLAIDKKRDIAILSSMGATNKTIKQIFLAEGGIVALSGAAMGLMLGLAISFLQQELGLISMGMQTTLMDTYPVKVEWPDIAIAAVGIVTITLIASLSPARLAVRKLSLTEL